MDRILAGETDYVKLKLDVWKQEHSDAIRVFREDESCYKAERKKETRATQIAAAKLNARSELTLVRQNHPISRSSNVNPIDGHAHLCSVQFNRQGNPNRLKP
jgi:hypothetical protein